MVYSRSVLCYPCPHFSFHLLANVIPNSLACWYAGFGGAVGDISEGSCIERRGKKMDYSRSEILLSLPSSHFTFNPLANVISNSLACYAAGETFGSIGSISGQSCVGGYGGKEDGLF